MEAWQNLIRVLTHEIKNSLTPIASLAASVEAVVRGAARPPDADCRTRKIREALQMIQKRSQGLLQFVDTYRDLTHIPEPEFKTVPGGRPVRAGRAAHRLSDRRPARPTPHVHPPAGR